MDELVVSNPFGAVQRQNVQVEAKKAAASTEIQAALVVAQTNRRNTMLAAQESIDEFKRYSLAQVGLYAYPQGNQTVSGLSIRAAEVLARCWGNLAYGFNELQRDNGMSVVESFCWDLQSNVLIRRTMHQSHARKAGKIIKQLEDPRDINNMIANNAQRNTRACILEQIPKDVLDAVTQQIKNTLKTGELDANGKPKVPFADRVRNLVSAFKQVGVDGTMIEKRLKHNVSLTTGEEFTELYNIYQALRDNEAKREDFFEFEREREQSADVADLSEKLKAQAAAELEAKAAAADKEEKERLENEKLLNDWLDAFDKNNGDPAKVRKVLGGKFANEWLKTATNKDIVAALAKLKELKP